MPELPEVETIVRGLRRQILGLEIIEARLRRADMLKKPRVARRRFDSHFSGKKFVAVDRLGKFLLFTLSDQSRLVAHLGMTGKFVLADGKEPQSAYLCSQFFFKNGRRLDHIDLRRFGRLEIYRPGEKISLLERLGADPLSTGFGAENLRPLIFGRNGKRRKRAMHTLLMDQSLISGVGNIYASEALFRSRIRPQRRADKVKRGEIEALAGSLRSVLEEAIAAGGTTVSDYRRVDDKPGNFRLMLNVYDREGDDCRQCGTPIKRLRLGGRSAFYCAKCQI
jgi:formamidopyrimidine-DNA glycosylase